MNVNAVQQRFGDALLVLGHGRGCASAGLDRVIGVAARAGLLTISIFFLLDERQKGDFECLFQIINIRNAIFTLLLRITYRITPIKCSAIKRPRRGGDIHFRSLGILCVTIWQKGCKLMKSPLCHHERFHQPIFNFLMQLPNYRSYSANWRAARTALEASAAKASAPIWVA